ncbi:MAG: type II secretion system F family protein [Planctomycetales bacterium]|nr:type II secretion system F family protein [Planctomycetales bacterium]
MSLLSLDGLAELNAELLALDRAGICLELELGDESDPLQQRLQHATAALAMRMARGESLEQALQASGSAVPTGYSSLVRAIEQVGEAGPVLDRLRQRALAKRTVDQIGRRALIYPLIVLALAVVAIFLSTSKLQPLEQEVYRDFRIPPGAEFDLLTRVQTSEHVWFPALIIILFITPLVIQRRNLGRRSLGSVRRYDAVVDQAHFADQLALLLEQAVPWPDAVSLAGGLAGAAPVADSGTNTAHQSAGGGNRPLLQWALGAPLRDDERLAFIQFARDSYWRLVRRKAFQLRLSLPALACAIVGGSAVLTFGWLVFAPWSEMLAKLALPE